MLKRLRILAGPNGSGKTSVYKELRDRFHWGVFVNADEIEHTLRSDGELDLREYGISGISLAAFQEAYNNYFAKWNTRAAWPSIHYNDGIIRIEEEQYVDSYFAAFLVTFIRDYLLDKGISFSIETVMSHPSKIDLMKTARQKGYRVYLYYVATESSEINVGRVRTRVAEGGHNVPEEKIHSRYKRSLAQLFDAIRCSDRAYLFDNSGQKCELVAEYDRDNNDFNVRQLKLWLQLAVLNKI